MKNNTIEQLLKEIARFTNTATSKQEAIDKGLSWFYDYDYVREYGGYGIYKVDVARGSHFSTGFDSGRLSAPRAAIMLRGILYGLSLAN